MSSMIFDKALKVVRQTVPNTEVARYYLKSELPNIILASNPETQRDIYTPVDRLGERELWRLLEALSYTYRMNGMFHLLTNKSLDWAEVELPVSAISLSGMTPATNKIVYSGAVNRSVIKFVDYLDKYFKAHLVGNDDPEGLNELRPRKNSIQFETLITMESRGKITILDGSHRLIEMVQAGATIIRAYAGVRSKKTSKHMAGDSTFLTLRQLYGRYRTDEQRQKIIDTTIMLAKSSTDGRAAIKTYWIEHARSEKIKNVGRNMLKAL